MRRRPSPSVRTNTVVLLLLAAAILSSRLRAEEAAKPEASEDETALAKKTQNPVADLISVPFQNNFNFNTGPRDLRPEHPAGDSDKAYRELEPDHAHHHADHQPGRH